MQKIVLTILGILLLLAGGTWMGQGADLLPGKVMRGDPQWILWGAILAAIGVALLYGAHRRRPSPPP